VTQIDLSKFKGAELTTIQREIKYHKNLSHPNIIQFYGHEIKNNKHLILLEYAEGGDLFNLLVKKGAFDEKTVCKFFVQTALALHYLHSVKVIHRDIKPENLLLDGENNIKLCDFGWCAEYDTHTVRRTICGTYEYMAPEILFHKPQSAAVDVWALGVLLFEMFHNKPPVSARSLKEMTSRVASILLATHLSSGVWKGGTVRRSGSHSEDTKD